MRKDILLIFILVICIVLLFLMYRMGYVMGVNNIMIEVPNKF